ncbi:MAG: hypothetical protein BWY08_01493 [Bacteroidetes bacterium ADurb.Bin174]|nr:MAG: hypothetical protein BWY08_01493 [Bacteroidetes bacterium ADurb.Bin174]
MIGQVMVTYHTLINNISTIGFKPGVYIMKILHESHKQCAKFIVK